MKWEDLVALAPKLGVGTTLTAIGGWAAKRFADRRKADQRMAVSPVIMPDGPIFLEVRYLPEGAARRFYGVMTFISPKEIDVGAVTLFDPFAGSVRPNAVQDHHRLGGGAFRFELRDSPHDPIPTCVGGLGIRAPNQRVKMRVQIFSLDTGKQQLTATRSLEPPFGQ